MKKYLPHLVVFLSSMGVMIIELAASRIISKHFGNSLFTWTGVIGIVLAGISVGNWFGGRLADRYEPDRTIGIQLFTASILVFGILLLDFLIGSLVGRHGDSGFTFQIILQSLFAITILFFLPAAALGTISPVMAKYALSRTDRVGGTVGSIYALSSVGSIVGTFLSGFVLIPFFGVRLIVFLVALVLAVLGLIVKPARGKTLIAAWVGFILLGLFLWGYAPAEAVGRGPADRVEGTLYAADSPYSHITVKNLDGGAKRILIMDGLIHNMHDLNDPDNLLYEYERIFLALTEAFLRDLYRPTGEQRPIKARENRERVGVGLLPSFQTLTLGGGAMTFPSYLARNYPQGQHDVVEIDPRVVEVAYRYFDAPKSAALRVHPFDARLFVHRIAREGSQWDLVYLDAFNSFSIPYHLTTREFTTAVSTLLRANGLLLANAIDIPKSGRFLGAYHATLSSVFPHLVIYGSPLVDRDRRSTFVLAAARFPIPYEELHDPEGNLIAKRLDPVIQADILTRNGKRPLTDDHAPVENLMIPVFLDMIR